MTENGGFTLVGAEQTRMFHEVRIVHGLALEINTGMKMSRGISMVEVAKRGGMVSETTRAKKKALKECVQFMENKYENWTPSDSVTKALGK